MVFINLLRYCLKLLKKESIIIFTEENDLELDQRSNKDTTKINDWNSTYNTTIIYNPVHDNQSTTQRKTAKYGNHTLNIKKTTEHIATMFAMMIFGIAFSSVVLLAYITVSIVDHRRKKVLREYTM